MDCGDFVQHLCAYLDGEVNPDQLQHLAGCRCCRRLAVSCEHTIRIYRSQPAPELPAAIHRKVMDHVGQRLPPYSPTTHLR